MQLKYLSGNCIFSTLAWPFTRQTRLAQILDKTVPIKLTFLFETWKRELFGRVLLPLFFCFPVLTNTHSLRYSTNIHSQFYCKIIATHFLLIPHFHQKGLLNKYYKQTNTCSLATQSNWPRDLLTTHSDNTDSNPSLVVYESRTRIERIFFISPLKENSLCSVPRRKHLVLTVEP